MSATSPMKILLLFDFPEAPPKDLDYLPYLRSEGWENESNVYKTLRKLGHDVKPFGIYDDIKPLFEEVQVNRPDLVFNLCESFRGDRDHEPNIVALFELLGLKYTGANPGALRLCKDKGLTKKILTYHNIRVPHFVVSPKSQPVRNLKDFTFPAFIKPLSLEASEGISQVSLVENEKEALERVRFLHDRFNADVIIEEYIEGRELYVGVIGKKHLTVLPSRELFFREVPEGAPKFATYRAKWDDNYRKRWGISNGHAKALPHKVHARIVDACKKIYKLFQITGYGRIDLRVTPQGDVVFLEANPNPSIAREDDFAQAAEKAGLDYETLIARILHLAA